MKSFIGNSSPARGWALLLALLLGAGMMISACGEEEVPAPTTPAPPPAPPPAPAPEPTPEPTGPATPAGLRASAGAGYIEWTWDAVEGAFGYQGQFSTDNTFTDADTTYLIIAPQTSHRVHNEASGYFRVRSGAGTSQADLQFSDWSDAVSGTANVAPTPTPTTTPLSVPGNVRTSARQNTTITVAWDSVTDAEAYEVQQQASGVDSWSGASCDGAGNRVTATECVASDLERGTQYSFRVRAVPDAADTDLATGPWSAAINATTTGRAPVTLEDGGLNLRWRSEGEDQGAAPQITWTWDPVDDRALQPLIDHYVALLRPTNALDDCPNLSAAPLDAADTVADADASYNRWHDLDSDISFTLTVADLDGTTGLTGEVRGLCVVRTWEDERKIRQFGEVSAVWGSTVPYSTTGNTKRDNTSTSVTTSIGWEFERDAGFDYVLRLLTTGADTGQATTDPADCAGGAAVESPDSVGRQNVSIFHTERNPDPYTIHQLCARVENDYGASEWTFVGGDTGSATSRPTSPSTPSLVRDQSDIVQDDMRLQTVNSLFWSVGHKTGTPVDGDDYVIAVFRSTEDTIPRNDEIQTRCNAANAATGTADILLATDEKLDTSGTDFARYNGNSAFDLEYAPTGTLLASTNAFDQYYFYMCIRADDTPTNADDGNHGPWTISRSTGFVGGSLLSPDVAGLSVTGAGVPATGTATQGQFTATWTANAAATRYEIQYVVADTDSVSDPVDNTTIRSTADEEYVVTQSFPNAANRGSSGTFEGRFRVRYYRTAGGITLRGNWTSVVNGTVTYP